MVFKIRSITSDFLVLKTTLKMWKLYSLNKRIFFA